ncbi:hypothetical protein CTEN210_12179 [Chaetoceros tenuissimus]|uniref:MYND-type domain-containing protein n=1 Tax=Chaetoceros tenuissimus TaxID=426638 RepID=A0AAD3D0T0_9STRA|nr:hypothetical protein CTEN210_12179 [Chaetoceros tenuissimus]
MVKMTIESVQKGIDAINIQDDSAEAALERCNKAIDATSSPDAQLLASRASAFYRLEKYRDAIKDCEDALEKDPKCLLALQTCGKSFFALKEYGSAAAELRDAQAVSFDESIERELSKIYKKLNQEKLEKFDFDEKQGGWQGPGERNTKNCAKKNKKIIKKATYGTKNEAEWLNEKWNSQKYIPNASNQAKVQKLGDGYATRKIRKYDPGFTEKADKLQNLCVEFCEVLSTSTKEERIQLVRKIEKSGDELQNEIIKVLLLHGIHDIGFIPCYLPDVITNKCIARFDCGVSIGPETMVPCKKETYPIAYELFEAAIKDADECIRLLHFPEYIASLSPTMKANPMDTFVSQNSVEMNFMLQLRCMKENPILAMYARQKRPQMNSMIMMRGKSYQYLEEYELAMNDFRAVCSRKRMDSPETWNQPPSLRDATMECLNTATLIKLRDKVPRPHYTKEELDKFEKEVGLGLYSAEKYFCGFCNAKKSNKVNLRLCSGCKNAWFCSRECLKKAWKAGHKAKCKPLIGRHVSHMYPISMEQIQYIMKDVEETGFCCMQSPNNCWVICQENGKYFDSLSNCELNFQKMEGGYFLRVGSSNHLVCSCCAR